MLLGVGSSVAGGVLGQATGALSNMAATALTGAVSSWFSPGPASPVPVPRPAGFANGADFIVGGRGGVDTNLVQFMATRGERVQVTPAGRGGGGAQVVVNIQTPDPAAFRASRGQIAASLSQAVARGRRNL